jgi:hypothetical protein
MKTIKLNEKQIDLVKELVDKNIENGNDYLYFTSIKPEAREQVINEIRELEDIKKQLE